MSDDLVKRLRETQTMYEQAGVDGSEGALQAREAADRIEELEAKLETATEHAFKEGLRYSINVKISDEHDVQTAWDWSKLKQKTLAEIQTEIKEDGMTDKIDTSPEAVRLHSPYHDGSMVLDNDGGWVSIDDYRALSARFAELKERYLAVVGDKINLRGEVATLEAKLAKARRSLVDGSELAHGVSFSKNETIASWGRRVEADINSTLAEIQDG